MCTHICVLRVLFEKFHNVILWRSIFIFPSKKTVVWARRSYEALIPAFFHVRLLHIHTRYWDCQGRAEVARLIFIDAGREFNDKRLVSSPFIIVSWPFSHRVLAGRARCKRRDRTPADVVSTSHSPPYPTVGSDWWKFSLSLSLSLSLFDWFNNKMMKWRFVFFNCTLHCKLVRCLTYILQTFCNPHTKLTKRRGLSFFLVFLGTFRTPWMASSASFVHDEMD